jgi:hypothetical protein
VEWVYHAGSVVFSTQVRLEISQVPAASHPPTPTTDQTPRASYSYLKRRLHPRYQFTRRVERCTTGSKTKELKERGGANR